MRRQVFTSIVLLAGLAGCASWKSRPVEKWTERDARTVLSQSPWVAVEGVRVVSRPGRSPVVWSQSQWIRFSWLAEPLRAALDRQEDFSNGRSIRFPAPGGVRSGSLATVVREMDFPVGDPILILVTSGILPDLLVSEGGPQMERATLQVGARAVPALNVFYQVDWVTHRKTGDGVAGTTVTVEDLERNPKGGQAVERAAWSYVVPEFRDSFTENHPTRAILIVFPRATGGQPTVTSSVKDAVLTIPLKERSLKATFHPNRMKFQGKFEF